MINYVIGDATNPCVKDGERFIVHICNNVGGWGAGFVLALSKKWKKPEQSYRSLQKYKLGEIYIIEVEKKLYVVNMISQNGYYNNNSIPLRYDKLNECLNKLCEQCKNYTNVSIHMPRIGCGLAGGEWVKVETIINNTLKHYNIYVYDLK